MADETPPSRRFRHCVRHNKRGWLDRAAAEAARAAMPDAADMDIYACWVTPELLHIGHPGKAVIALRRIERAGEGT
jgi:hypothetical protein